MTRRAHGAARSLAERQEDEISRLSLELSVEQMNTEHLAALERYRARTIARLQAEADRAAAALRDARALIDAQDKRLDDVFDLVVRYADFALVESVAEQFWREVAFIVGPRWAELAHLQDSPRGADAGGDDGIVRGGGQGATA